MMIYNKVLWNIRGYIPGTYRYIPLAFKYGLYMTAGYIYVSCSILFQTEQQISSSISIKSNIVSSYIKRLNIYIDSDIDSDITVLVGKRTIYM